LFGLSACATIPKESADLSIELGKRLSAIEDAHMVLIDKYFNEKRSRVDERRDIEFHYFKTFILCRKAGFNEEEVIAGIGKQRIKILNSLYLRRDG
jgi:hypothetical protein